MKKIIIVNFRGSLEMEIDINENEDLMERVKKEFASGEYDSVIPVVSTIHQITEE